MRDLNQLNRYRLAGVERRIYGQQGGATEGVFAIPSPEDGAPLYIIASAGMGWDHVSVSRADRCPTWGELEHVKRAFFEDQETAMQLHVPASDHVNVHPHVLHLWRPQDAEIPRPPAVMVG